PVGKCLGRHVGIAARQRAGFALKIRVADEMLAAADLVPLEGKALLRLNDIQRPHSGRRGQGADQNPKFADLPEQVTQCGIVLSWSRFIFRSRSPADVESETPQAHFRTALQCSQHSTRLQSRPKTVRNLWTAILTPRRAPALTTVRINHPPEAGVHRH